MVAKLDNLPSLSPYAKLAPFRFAFLLASPSDLARLAALLPAKELPAGLCNNVGPLSGFGFQVSSPLS